MKMTERSKALLLAAYWSMKDDQGQYVYSSLQFRDETADELRRLHDENQRLRLIVPQVLEDLNDKLCEDNLRLTAQRDQLIEALKEAMDVCGWPSAEFFYKALGAIVKAEKNT